MWGSEASDRLNRLETEEAKLGEFNRYVFGDLRFDGTLLYTSEPDCNYLTRVIDQRRGNPIGLSTIYLFLARRARLPVAGIGAPGHFLCRFQSARFEIFIDCFRRGTMISRADCIHHLRQSSIAFPETLLEPVSPRQILLRMCRNLVMTYAHLESVEEARRVQRYVEALTSTGR